MKHTHDPIRFRIICRIPEKILPDLDLDRFQCTLYLLVLIRKVESRNVASTERRIWCLYKYRTSMFSTVWLHIHTIRVIILMWGDSGWVCWVRYLKVAVPRHFFHFFHESNLSRPLLNTLKRFCRKVPFRGDIREISDFSLTSTARSWIFLNLKFEYLRENEFLSKSILDCYSGFQVDFFMKKCQKSRDTATLRNYDIFMSNSTFLGLDLSYQHLLSYLFTCLHVCCCCCW